MNYENSSFQNEWYDFLQHKFNPFKECPKKYGLYPAYQPKCLACQECVKQFLLLWPRGHAKTECTSVNYVSWLIGNNPNIHVNIVTKTASLAEDILIGLMTRFENDERYIEIFGELRPSNPKKWTIYELIVNRNEISKNPTIKATGLGGGITGGRSDLIIFDDIIDEENVRTKEQIEKSELWFYKILYPTLYPWGGILGVGTRWHYADLYSRMLPVYNSFGEMVEKNWWPNVDIKQAIRKDGTLLWPEYWTIEKLQDRRSKMGSILWDCQYQNDPTSMEGSLLKNEWLHSYEADPSSSNLRYAGIDPALGEGDLQAIATLSIDKASGQAYLEDAWAKAVPIPEFLRKINEFHQKHHYAKIFIESNAFQKILVFLPELSGLPIVPSQTIKDKEQRFIGMSSHFEAKRILINPTINLRSEFYTEWVQFPRGQHDDALDAVEIVTRETVGQHRQGFVFLGK